MQPLFAGGLQILPPPVDSGLEVCDPPVLLLQLPGQVFVLRLIARHERPALFPVAAGRLGKLLQLMLTFGGGILLRRQCRDFQLGCGDFFVDGIHLGVAFLQLLLGMGQLLLQCDSQGFAVRYLLLQGLILIVSAAEQVFDDIQLPLRGRNRLSQCIQQNGIMLLLLLEPKHLILRFPKLILGCGNVRLRLSRRFGRFLKLLIGLFQLGVGLAAALFQPGKLIGPGENAGGTRRGAAGHGTARIEHLTVQGDNPEAMTVPPCNGNGAVHILSNGRASQQILHNVPILGIIGQKVAAQSNKAIFPIQSVFLKPAAPDGGQGQECCSAAVSPAKEADGRFAVLLVLHHDGAHGRAQRRLNGNGIFVLGAQQLGYRPVNVPEISPG